ncbi:MAG: hypothetical protein RLY86_1598 [Pseudomonadota bacterium]|jgi:phosphoenolpyruvate carboxylase
MPKDRAAPKPARRAATATTKVTATKATGAGTGTAADGAAAAPVVDDGRPAACPATGPCASPLADRAVLTDVAAAGPLLSAPVARFKAGSASAPALAAELADALAAYRTQTTVDPFANPVLLLALDVSRRLKAGQMTIGDVEQLIQYLSADGFLARARRLGLYLGEADPAANTARLEALMDGLAAPGGTPRPFKEFADLVTREAFGIVITAHPTFNLSGALMESLSCLATGRDSDGTPLSPTRRDALIRAMATAEHAPEEMTLAREHGLSLVAIANIQAALRTLYAAVLRVARRHWPDRWMDLTPRLITVASWVGYDLDGRSDIRWSDTLHKRLIVQQAQLRHYLSAVKAIVRDLPRHEDLRHTLELVESRLALALNQVTDEIAAFGGHDAATDVAHVQRIAKRMHEGLPLRLVEAGHAIELIDRAIRLLGEIGAGASDGETVLEQLAVLRAELANYGLGMAHTHVRINATQLHNAIRKTVGMETPPDDPRYRQSYLNAITDLLDGVTPAAINFGSVLAERTSAKRLFMVVAQMLKYSDSRTPIRFLVAESEAAFTVLTALYYAKLFGVDDRVDISPLFETEKALEVGSRVIEQLLDNPHYADYVRRRGRLCIQTGYSDAGRYLGQIPASASIERLRLRVLRLFQQRGLGDVQLVIFDTHGESIGRGGHPAGLTDRLAYVSPPATLTFAAENGIRLKQEVSFQGGDGYLYFITPASALAVVTRIAEYLWGTEKPRLEDDPFYAEADYIREVFTTIKTFQVGLVEDPNYGALLAAFGTNLLYPSGSRAIKRVVEAPDDGPEEVMAARFRAIPHNAILLQMGLAANVLSGAGEAIDRDPEHFQMLYRTSPRFRQLMGMIEYGVAVASPDALRAYIDSLDPALWLTLADRSRDLAEADEMRRVAGHLEDAPTHTRLIKVFRRLYRDFGLLRDNLGRAGALPTLAGPNAAGEASTALSLLHALRLALLHEVFKLSTHIPPFSSQHAVSQKRLIGRVMHLDVAWAMEQLGRIFPVTTPNGHDGDFGETATYVSDDSQNYSQENDRIFRPLAHMYELIRRSGNALTQRIGFFG